MENGIYWPGVIGWVSVTFMIFSLLGVSIFWYFDAQCRRIEREAEAETRKEFHHQGTKARRKAKQ